MGFLKPWNTFEVGDWVSLICEVIYIDSDIGPHHCMALGYGKVFQLVGIQIQDGQVFTIADARICEVGKTVVLGVEDHTLIWPHVIGGYQKICSCIELCAGAGFSMEGICAAGFSPVASIESNEKFRDLHSAMHSTPFVCCDIGSVEALRAAFDLHAGGCTVMAGINCQPYSVAGDKLREQDLRATSLPKALMFAHLIRAQVVVLECTPLAKSDEFVQGLIREFAYCNDMTIEQQILELGNCWASRRDRWWCVIARRHFAMGVIPELPVFPDRQKVSDIMPYIKHWPDSDASQLVLSLYEHGKFLDYGGGLSPHFLDMNAQMATALHAWGNQIYPCKCGCRNGFSEERMRKLGLHGQLIPSRDMIERMGVTFPCCRHMHPSEVILLCGAFPGRPINGDMRLALAAAGQMASPMHSVWIFGYIKRHLQVFFARASVVDAEILLREWQSKVLSARDQMWPAIVGSELVPTRSVSLPSPPRVLISVGHQNAKGFLDIVASPGVTVNDLLEAERVLAGPGHDICSVTSLSDNGKMLPVTLDQVLQSGDFVCVCLRSHDSETTGDAESIPPPSLFDENGDSIMMGVEGVDVSEAVDLPLDLRRANDETSKDGGILDGAPAEKAEFDFTMWQDPLSKLSRQSLLHVLCPQVLTVGAFQGLRKQTISGVLRKLVMKNQDGAMGDDELLFHLQKVVQSVSVDQQIVVWDPLVMSALVKLRQGHVVVQWAATLPGTCTIVTSVVVGTHWIPLIWRRESNRLSGVTCFVPVEFREVVQDLHAYVCKICDCEVSQIDFAPWGPTARFCGTAAIRYVAHLLTGEPIAVSDAELDSMYRHDAEVFRLQCVAQVPRPWIWGLGAGDGHVHLSALLRQHGVEGSDLTSRCDKIFSALGKDEVVQALNSQHPWKNLKRLANNVVPPFQLIQPLELQKAVAARSQSKVPVGNRAMKAKGKGKGKQTVVHEVNPDSLRLESGVFVGDDHPLSQLKVSQIGPIASGVVLATLDQAMPYLQSAKQVSIGSLGIVVLNPPPVAPAVTLIGARVKFPVFCVANAEPLIVEGDLYQLGSKPVIKHSVAQTVHLETVETVETCVNSKPIQYILSRVLCLNRCQEEVSCDCPKWHVQTDGVTDPVMELWNRQWLSFAFAQVKPNDADMFSVTVRIPKQLEQKLLSVPGSDSICFEPRSLDGRKPSEEYYMVWTPRISAAQAVLLKQTNVLVVGLARLGAKWGLRCVASDASKLHESVKPDSEFLPAGQRQLYLIGPLPFGIVRQSLVEALRELGWSARPLHALPAARDVMGVMWKVQSTSAPPKSVLALKDGEAVITRFDQVPAVEQVARPVIGSSTTVNMCKNFAASKPKVDPFQVNDPWAKTPSVDAVMETAGVGDVVASLEQRVVDSVRCFRNFRSSLRVKVVWLVAGLMCWSNRCCKSTSNSNSCTRRCRNRVWHSSRSWLIFRCNFKLSMVSLRELL